MPIGRTWYLFACTDIVSPVVHGANLKKVDVVTFGWTKEASLSYGLDLEVRQLGIIAQQVLLLQMMHSGGEDHLSLLVLPPRDAVVAGGRRVPGETRTVRCCYDDLMQRDHMSMWHW